MAWLLCKIEGTDLAGPVVAMLDSGTAWVTPANTKVAAPATILYKAPDETGEAYMKLVLVEGPGCTANPAWSPDGWVVYYRTRTESRPSKWFSVAADGSSQPQPAQELPYWWRHNYRPQRQE